MKQEIILYKKFPEKLIEELKKHFIVHIHTLKNEMDPSFYDDLQRASGIIGSRLEVNRELLNRAPNLKIVVNTSVGYDNFDIKEITKRGIMATNTPDVLTETVADTVFGLILATARRIPEMDVYVKAGNWDVDPIPESLFGVDVHHKTLGIIGMGRIGAAIVRRAHLGFKMNILYHNRSRNAQAEKEYNAQYVDFDALFQKSDFVCVMAPLTKETVHLISKREFQLMKNTAVFINASRGKLVDEGALVEALQQKEILAAGLDVYSEEPVNKNHPLLKMKNVVTLPHIGSATKKTRYEMMKLGVENLIKGLNGEVPPTLINKEVLKERR
ncbi:2-hydroxyacid dehydrogenase [Gracilibacillus dipsosauri]|uniref:2-hydroxyacid dehydrogenase n=1 Tax=Gracilibacillus dipsosauri TaxID=178340 RepID=UPI00240A49C8